MPEIHTVVLDAHPGNVPEGTLPPALTEQVIDARPELVIPEAMMDAAPSADDPLYDQYMRGARMAAKRRLRPAVQPSKFAVAHGGPIDTDNIIYGDIHIEELPYLTSPIVEMVRDEMPDAILAADRGGRMLGLAVFGVWSRRYRGMGLPTIDGAIHFGRVSKRISDSSSELVIRNFLYSSGVTAEMAQRKADGDTRPIKIMMLDDWVNEGFTVDQTRATIERMFQGQAVDFMLGTMRGTRHAIIKHTVGDERREHAKGRWTDDSRQIGVDYTDWDGITPVMVDTSDASSLRARLRDAIEQQIEPSPYVPTGSLGVAALHKVRAFDRLRNRLAKLELLRTLGFSR